MALSQNLDHNIWFVSVLVQIPFSKKNTSHIKGNIARYGIYLNVFSGFSQLLALRCVTQGSILPPI